MTAVAPRSSTATRFLRFRFDSTKQVRRHFHVFAGRVILFFPTLLSLKQGEQLVLEVSFTNSEQHCALRGSVLGRSESKGPGWWLEFPAIGLVAGLQSATATPKRRHRRFPTDGLLFVEHEEGMPLVCKLGDLSLGGANLSGISRKTRPGDPLRLAMPSSDKKGPAPLANAQVAWVQGSEVGVLFARLTSTERVAVAALVEKARARSATASEVRHPRICRCAEGLPVLEPALPRSAHRPGGSR